ncbi:AMP-binding protein [Burkholderia multivorans]|uniref:class I adenylate-forming enzyme family protein n=1 Tax=Burkholderia multivorans TaxID=87883 RepID=UPI001C230D35|nr:AMP-binding protein [Burkholderia multivorans]MBU9282571.1 AMP-binding protein [Burkholderia multivorans]MBU9301006.1 AMP-binding protein [Burkholderia multivorans]HEM7850526.1 AMP-binding protein [Burkholderia multivorans]
MDWNRAETFGDLVDLAVAAFGDKVALRDEYRALTYQEFAGEIERIAAALFSYGLRPGARVAVLSQNRVEVPVLLGLCRYGFVPVPLNWRLPAEDLGSLLQDCEPAAFFVEERYLDIVAKLPHADVGLTIAINGSSSLPQHRYADMLAESLPSPASTAQAEDAACIIYTSGTTSAPKGAVLSHAGIVQCCQDCARAAIGFTPDDLTLMVMPLFHVGGIWYYMFPSIFSGATTLLQERFEPEQVVRAFEEELITNIHVVPTMLADLLNRPTFVRAATRLRLIVYAGSSMPSELLNRAMMTLRSCEFAQAYGSTEAGSITALSPSDHRLAIQDPAHRRLLRSCGKPLPLTEVRIEDDFASASERHPVGEIQVRSAKLMSGYWRRPEATADRLTDDGWFRTGDLGQFDDEGYLYIVDRKNDMVISGGENIFPFEVEEVLHTHPAVEEASVFGIPDTRWVERLVAAVVLRPDAKVSEADIIAYARQHLPGYKTPKSIHIVQELPKNAVGKILRKTLRERFNANDSGGAEQSQAVSPRGLIN